MQVKTIFHTQLIKATSVLSSCCFQVVFLLTMNDVSPVLSINTHNGRVLVIVTCTISYTSSTVGGGQREHDRYVGVSHCAGQQRGVCGRGGGAQYRGAGWRAAGRSPYGCARCSGAARPRGAGGRAYGSRRSQVSCAGAS